MHTSSHPRFWLMIGGLLLASLACTTLPLTTPTGTAQTPPPAGAAPTWPADQASGTSRATPFAFGELATAETWQAQVRDLVRGDQAWALLHEANMFNEPPAEGWEYLLVRLWVKCTAPQNSGSHSIAFGVTGDYKVLYSSGGAVAPEPRLPYEFTPGMEAEGWLVFRIRLEETNLLLRGDELISTTEEKPRYLALQEGAKIEVDPGLLEIDATAVGADKAMPAALGETVTTEDWEITVLEVYRGAEALQRLQAANPYNAQPAAGMEYVLVSLRVRYIGTAEGPAHLDGFKFKMLGSGQQLYDAPALVEPQPELNAYLFPGGEAIGWVGLEVDQAKEKPTLVFKPGLLSNYEIRYLALQ